MSRSEALTEAADRLVWQAFEASRDPAWLEDARRGEAIRAIASTLRHECDEILTLTQRETALTLDELRPEFDRMVRTIDLYAELAASGTWRRAARTPREKDAARAIGPNHDLRTMLIPRRGAAIVFGASNFPLAYGVLGGDTIGAMATGLGVVVKEHPAHRRTGQLLAKLARRALEQSGQRSVLLGYAEDDDDGSHAVARTLVLHEMACAVGFTGSKAGGLALERLTRERERPIPVFAEMGSTNPVFVSARALAARGEAIARELGSALLMRYGQQCTCPGLVFLESEAVIPGVDALRREMGEKIPFDDHAERFEKTLASMVKSSPAREMLSPRVREGYVEQASRIGGYMPEVQVLAEGKTGKGSRVAPAMLFRTDADELRSLRFLSEEAFGPAAVVARLRFGDMDLVEELLNRIEGHLAASVYAEPAELADPASPSRQVLERLMDVAGRVVVNGPTTGVRVAEAMVHGGPFPATNAPETTAVGPRSLERWCRPVCLQNWPEAALPQALR